MFYRFSGFPFFSRTRPPRRRAPTRNTRCRCSYTDSFPATFLSELMITITTDTALDSATERGLPRSSRFIPGRGSFWLPPFAFRKRKFRFERLFAIWPLKPLLMRVRLERPRTRNYIAAVCLIGRNIPFSSENHYGDDF